ncbi:MAG: type VI secretion system baseplate subunit TssE [Acidobacteria bacterium]|nr:type VI secretion system baseplate subunit TssE [Acidobacteriota bacterium]MCG3195292.1 hypothetical protein [Thermoanaerobaculia bacterium]MCK6685171.1 type VI secretion system baseplate subunit TssE [Thermoanaerobaculia bacterium]
MPRYDNEVRVTPSVLDRLIDYEPEVSREAPSSRAKSLRLLKQSVRRDLEWLFNTRFTADVPESLENVQESVLVYGLPDFTALSIKKIDDRDRLQQAIEKAVAVFEPRLDSVVVVLEEGDAQKGVRFRIEARLLVDPAPEPVTFDTAYQPQSGTYFVRGEA